MLAGHFPPVLPVVVAGASVVGASVDGASVVGASVVGASVVVARHGGGRPALHRAGRCAATSGDEDERHDDRGRPARSTGVSEIVGHVRLQDRSWRVRGSNDGAILLKTYSPRGVLSRVAPPGRGAQEARSSSRRVTAPPSACPLVEPHHLADEEARELAADLVVAVAEALPLVGVGGDGRVDRVAERVARHRLEAAPRAMSAGSPPASSISASTRLAWVAVSSPRVSSAIKPASDAAGDRVGRGVARGSARRGRRPARRVGARRDGRQGQLVERPARRSARSSRHRRRTPADGLGETGPTCGGQQRQRGPDVLDPLGRRLERHEVGLGEVPVVVGLLLRPAS